MMSSRAAWHRWTRPAIGIAISIGFLAATLSRVDVALMSEAWAGVEIPMLALAVLLSFGEVAVRALRWLTLLRPLTDVSYRSALAYLSIGHLANAVLPVRLGDVARAFLAGGRFKISRASVLGTVAVERVADAGLLGLAAMAGVLLGYHELIPAVAILAGVGLGVIVILAVLAVVLGRDVVAASRVGAFARRHMGRFVAGASALRSPSSVLRIGLLTITSFALAIAILHTVLAAVGLSLPVWQSALVMAAVTLSTAIPSGPASLGTYEFVGVGVLGSLGFPPEPSLLAIALVHLAVTMPPAGMGLVAAWSMGIRRLVPRPKAGVPRAAPGRTP